MIKNLCARIEKARWLGSETTIVLAIFFATLWIFYSSPITYDGDSRYSMLLSENLLKNHSFVLDGYAIPHNPLAQTGAAYVDGAIYQIEVVNDHFYYFFPPGTSVLSVPFIAVLDLFGKYVVGADGSYSIRNEIEAQRGLAALLMAALAAIFYRTARLLLPISWSVGSALGGALGTQIWSTASRAMWTHTWGVLLLGWMIYQLLAHETGRRRLNPVLLASALSWTYFVRPTNSVFVVGVTVYILVYYRALFIPYALTGALWFAGFVAYSWENFGTVLPSYYQTNRLGFTTFWEALAGNLVSPSRGFLVNVPITLFVIYLLVRYWRRRPWPRLVWLALGVSLLHLLAVASFSPWFGGICFGARYTTELVPWWLLLGVLSIKAMLDEWKAHEARGVAGMGYPPLVFGGILLLASIAINGHGAESRATVRWNDLPKTVNFNPARVWDVTYPQFLAGIVNVPKPRVFPILAAGQRVSFGDNAGSAYQYDGWSDSDPTFCWTEEHRATLIFGTIEPGITYLRMKVKPYCFGKRLMAQEVKIELNHQPIATFAMRDAVPREYTVNLPLEGVLRGHNTLTFELPDARSPRSLGNGPDARCLGIAMYWVEAGCERQ